MMFWIALIACGLFALQFIMDGYLDRGTCSHYIDSIFDFFGHTGESKEADNGSFSARPEARRANEGF